MRSIILVIFTVLLSTGYNFSQLSNEDKLKEAIKLSNNAKYDSALILLSRVLSAFETDDNQRGTIQCLQRLALCKSQLDLFDEAKEDAERALEYSKKDLLQADTLLALSHNSLGFVLLTASQDYDEALRNFNKALDIYAKAGITYSLGLGEIHNNRGVIFFRQSRYTDALLDYHKALNLYEKILGSKDPKVGVLLNDIAGVHFYRGDNYGVLETLEKIVTLFKANYGDAHPTIARVYNNIGVVNMELGNYYKSIEYLNYALKINKSFFGETHTAIGICNNFLGMNYGYIGDPEKSEKYFKKSLSIIEQTTGQNSQLYHLPLRNLANMYVDNGKFNKAILMYKNVLKRHSVTGNDLTSKATVHYALGKAYLGKDDLDSASFHFSKSLDMRKRLFNAGIRLARAYYRMGDIYLKRKNTDQALEYYQQALICLSPDFISKNPKDDPDNIPDIELARVLHHKANTYRVIYNESNLITDLERSLQLHMKAFEIEELVIRRFGSNEYRSLMAEFMTESFEKVLLIAMKLYELTSQDRFLATAASIIELNKSQRLKLSHSYNSIQQFFSIPDSLLLREKNFKVDLNFYQNKLNSEFASLKDDSVKESDLKDKIFYLTSEHDKLVGLFERKYPSYYQIKYKHEVFDVNEFQKSLKDDEALVEYFMADNNFYTLLVTKSSVEILKQSKNDLTNDLRKFLKEFELTNTLDISKQAKLGYKLYQNVLEPVFSRLSDVSKIYVVPDGELGYLPFDLLQTSDIEQSGSFNYVIENYNIAYRFSGSSLFNPNYRNDMRIMGVAPDYTAVEDSVYATEVGVDMALLGQLDFNQTEIQKATLGFDGVSLLKYEATERKFKEMSNNYSILHLAMHALIDNEDPMRSKLVFTPGIDSIEDNYLHAFELYNMRLTANMAVLSACNTGYGKFQKGEGIQSLARAFAYAGVPSVVMSQWQVDDESTSRLMELFYENLSDGMSKSEALRQAKLTFVDNADPASKHPFFWGAFVVIGNDDPLVNKNYNILIFSMVIMIFSGILWGIDRLVI